MYPVVEQIEQIQSCNICFMLRKRKTPYRMDVINDRRSERFLVENMASLEDEEKVKRWPWGWYS